MASHPGNTVGTMEKHSISTAGIGAEYLTAKKGTSATTGYPCRFTANNTVADAAANAEIHGVIALVRGELVSVQYRGFVTLPYTGTAPTVGYGILAANGTSGVKTAQSGRSYLITNVDTVAQTVDLLL